MKLLYPILIFSLGYTTCNDNRIKNNSAGENNASTSTDGIRIVKTGLNYPWEITLSKDGFIWMTEREGRVSRLDPATGRISFSYTIDEVESRNEGGLLGMALHPDFLRNGFVYVVYNYKNRNKHLEKFVRYTYADNNLSHPVILLDGIEGSTNHNGSRIWVTNEADVKIFLTAGDAFDQSLPQQINSRNGKIFRINPDGSIPHDNPFPGNPVWSFGHRNPQGLVMVNNILYESEHGPDIEDEINIIEKGCNYGWPDVKGPCNGNELEFCRQHNVKEPIWSTGDNTLAVSGMDYYDNDRITQWKNSLLVMTLKNSSIVQLQLSADGRSVTGTKTFFKNYWGRLRDVCVAPNGKVYVCTSNGGHKDVLIEISKL